MSVGDWLLAFSLLILLTVFGEWVSAHAGPRDEERVLRALAARDGDWTYGLDLVRGGAASRSTVYLVLSRLEERGLVESRMTVASPIRGLPTRREYRILDAGLDLLERRDREGAS